MSRVVTQQALLKQKESSFTDYIALMKPRVMSLVVFTAFCGMLLAKGGIHPFIAFESILLIALGAGAAASINMWYDADIDRIMQRTRNRPTARGVIEPQEALSFGIILSVISVLMLSLVANILSAFILAFTILYYILIYTMWLKRSSIQNVVIGGVSGALPPVIGWVVVDNQITIEPIIMFLIIFTWTPPHSWALALFRSGEYAKCNIPMMPAVKGSSYTKQQILAYSLLMVAVSYLPYYFNMMSIAFAGVVTLLNIIFIYFCCLMMIFPAQEKQYAKKLFAYSILYLFGLFLLLLLASWRS